MHEIVETRCVAQIVSGPALAAAVLARTQPHPRHQLAPTGKLPRIAHRRHQQDDRRDLEREQVVGERHAEVVGALRRAALAPAEPSAADLRVAAQAQATAAQARGELARLQAEGAAEREGESAAGVFVRDFARALTEQGVTVHVVAPGADSGSEGEERLSISRFGTPRLPLSLLNPLHPGDWRAIATTLRRGAQAVAVQCQRQRPDHLSLDTGPRPERAISPGRGPGSR